MENLKKITTSQNRINLLNASYIYTLNDIINHLPYRYDYIEETMEDDLKVIVEGKIITPPKVFYKGKFSIVTLNCLIKDEEYTVKIFNRHFLMKSLHLNDMITIIGKRERNTITATQILIGDLNKNKGIFPIYSLKDGLTSKVFSNYVKKAFTLINNIDSFIPIEFNEKYQFINKKDALYNVHFPNNKDDIIKGMKMLKYEEFLQFELTMQYIKLQREKKIGKGKVFDVNKLNAFIKSLPFKLTKDQQKATLEIINDLKKETIMYRFLQGDVGSGKTVVSSIALYVNYLASYQGALMAPTEVLAMQHYETLKNFFKDTNVKIGLLVGVLSIKEKEEMYEKIKNAEIDIIVGTHALFQDKVIYHNLGLVITDEQHRFGVTQRKALKNKGEDVDFLVMSATPIPRTLALSLYGDMDVSEIHSKIGGRLEIITKYFKGNSMKPFLGELTAYLNEGGQVYVVCPLIEENPDLSLKSATQIYNAMSSYFKEYNVGLLNGQLKDDEKNRIMELFHQNKIQILVSTTVIEVGIDVKNANMMVIYDAERFGLSQIHQLRGRVGRGDKQGYCYLLSKAENSEAIERLKFIESHLDGYEISMYDLKTRGPGEVLGQRQSGVNQFVFGDVINDLDILKMARDDALYMLDAYYKYNEFEDKINIVIENIKNGNEYID